MLTRDVDAGQRFSCLRHHVVNLLGVGDVGLYRDCATAQPPDLVGGLLDAVKPSSGDCHIRACLGKHEGDLFPDAAGRSGHQRRFAFQVEIREHREFSTLVWG